MTMAEQMAMEQEMLAHLRQSSAEELREEGAAEEEEAQRMRSHARPTTELAQEAHAPQTHERGLRRVGRREGGGAAAATARPRSRLDRDLGLTDDRAGGGYDWADARAVRPGGEDSEDADESGGEEGDARNEYEVMLDAMRRRRARDDREHEEDDEDDDNNRQRRRSRGGAERGQEKDGVEERHNRLARREDEQRQRFATLITALQELTTRLPTDSDAYGSATGTLEFLRGGSFATGIVQKEIPLMLREIAEELPLMDTSGVRFAFNNIFPVSSS